MSVAPYRFDAYIASAKSDVERVSIIVQRLRSAGLKVASRDEIFLPGDPVLDRISSVMSESRTGLIVFSRASAADRWIQEEYKAFIRRSVELGRRFIPILIDDVNLPDFASNREPSDLRDADALDFKERIEKLVVAIGSDDVDQMSGPTSSLPAQIAQQPRIDILTDEPWAEAAHRSLMVNLESELGDVVAQAELPISRLRRIWRAALGVLAPEPDESLRGSRDLIRAATDIVVSVGQAPAALTVAEYIAASSASATAESIRASIANVANKYALPLPRPAVRLSDSENSSILVRIIPNAPGSKRYRSVVSVYLDISGPAEPLYWNESAQTVGEIRVKIGREISKALERIDDVNGRTLIEFLISRDLFRVPIEEWTLEKKVEIVGSLYPVIIRDTEGPDFARGKSRSRWEASLIGGPGGGTPIKLQSCAEPLTAGELQAWFELDISRTVLVLPSQPTKNRGWNVLDAVFASGVSVIVWPRSECPCRQDCEVTCSGEAFSADFVLRMNGKQISDLPWLVKQFRNEAALPSAEAFHCGRRMVLMWNDPNRIVDDLPPLSGPEQLTFQEATDE
jgi:hypothetical protein